MARWNVSPNEGVTGNGPEFTFPKNTGREDINYRITYTGDSGCIAQTTYTVHPCACTTYADVPKIGLIIDTPKSGYFMVFSYIGDLNVDGNQLQISVKLQNNSSSEDEYVKIDSITPLTNPYGEYQVNYTVKKLPTENAYTNYFIISNDCEREPIQVKITIKNIPTP